MRHGTVTSLSDNTVHFSDGNQEEYDLIVCATGYTGFPDLVNSVLGSAWGPHMTAGRGRDAEGEMIGYSRPCGVPGTYVLTTNLNRGRLFSRITALQIALELNGKAPERWTIEKEANTQV